MEEKRIVILGAGPAGLAAAHELTANGVSPLVLEKEEKVGGIARTESYKGHLFDIGGHRFFTKIGRVHELWHSMLGEDLIRVRRLSRIYYKGRFFDYPIRFLNALRNLGVTESLLIPSSYLKAQILPFKKEESFEQWVSNRFGRRLYDTFFRTYTEKVWGMPCSDIKADWAVQRIRGLSLIAAVSNALFGNQNAKTLISEFDYPIKGPGMMWERFKEEIEAAGGEVRLKSEVKGLEIEDGRVLSVLCEDFDGREVTIPANHVISSIPLTGLVLMLYPPAPAGVVEAAGQLSYRSFILVGLIVEKGDLFPDQWIYIHDPGVKVGRIQNFKNWSAAMVPLEGNTCIGMEYFCTEGDEAWNMEDGELLSLAVHELAKLGLAEKDKVTDGFVVRQPKAYPVYDKNYRESLAELRDFISSIPNLETIGRNGMHRYNNMDHSMYTGMLAARNAVDAGYDVWAVNEEEVYLEEDKDVGKRRGVPKEVLIKTFARLDKTAFGVAIGTVAGLIILVSTLWLLVKGGEVVGPNLRLLGQYFFGYGVSVKGAFIGSCYAFLWGFLFGWFFGYLRNFFLALYVYRVKKRQEMMSLKEFFDHL